MEGFVYLNKLSSEYTEEGLSELVNRMHRWSVRVQEWVSADAGSIDSGSVFWGSDEERFFVHPWSRCFGAQLDVAWLLCCPVDSDQLYIFEAPSSMGIADLLSVFLSLRLYGKSWESLRSEEGAMELLYEGGFKSFIVACVVNGGSADIGRMGSALADWFTRNMLTGIFCGGCSVYYGTLKTPWCGGLLRGLCDILDGFSLVSCKGASYAVAAPFDCTAVFDLLFDAVDAYLSGLVCMCRTWMRLFGHGEMSAAVQERLVTTMYISLFTSFLHGVYRCCVDFPLFRRRVLPYESLGSILDSVTGGVDFSSYVVSDQDIDFRYFVFSSWDDALPGPVQSLLLGRPSEDDAGGMYFVRVPDKVC